MTKGNYLFEQDESGLAVERLTALWVLNEAGLGGLMHALKSPFTGIIVGGTAIVLITLIAYFAKQRTRAILKATAIVLIIKATVSPHSPLPAYFAVTFQAMIGALLFGVFSNLRVAALLLGIIGLVETALQKVLVMTIIYGNSIWKSIDVFVNYVLQQLSFINAGSDFSASVWLVSGYLGMHVLAGVFIGRLAGLLPGEIMNALRASRPRFESGAFAPQIEAARARRPFWKSKIVKLLFLLTIIAATLTFLTPAMDGSPKGWHVVLRAATVLLFWYFIAAPVLMKLLRKFLKRKKARYGHEIENALRLFPQLKAYAAALWNEQTHEKGRQRWKQFLVALIVFALIFDQAEAEAETALTLRSEISN